MRIAIGIALAACLTACARPYLQEPPWPAPTPMVRVPEVEEGPIQRTSLWVDNSPYTASYGDRRAREVGDLLTVLVVESSEASREASTGVSRDTSVAAGTSSFLGSGMLDPDVNASVSNSFKGTGSTRTREALRTRVSARIVDVLDDGNLVVEGRRQVKVNQDTQFLFVRGIARPEDISSDNTITSVALADAQILYGGKGLLANQQRPGWMYRILDVVLPF